MGTEFIPGEHLAHLLRPHEKGPMQAAVVILLRKANSRLRADREEVIEFLEKQQPGTRERLNRLYSFSGRRSIILWDLPVLQKATPVQAFAAERDLTSKRPTNWYPVRGSERIGENRVLRAMLDPANREAHLIVLLHANGTYQDEHGETQEIRRTYPVNLKIDFQYETPLLEVHANAQSARSAMLIALDWLLQIEVPRYKSTAQTKILRQIVFSESNISKFARGHGLEPIIVGGPDPVGEVGERVLRGKLVGHRRQALNSAAISVQQQNQVVNAERAYNAYYKHGDGHVECAEIGFNFYAKPPHITLNRGASTAVVKDIVSKLYRHLGGR